MTKGEGGRVLIGLGPAEFELARAAMAAAGIAAAALEILPEDGIEGFLLVGPEDWARLRALPRPAPRSRAAVLVLPPGLRAGAQEYVDQGAFDWLPGGEPGWAERAAAYLKALIAVERRFSGGMTVLERRYEDLVHSLPDIVYELDSDGKFTFVNNSVAVLGYKP